MTTTQTTAELALPTHGGIKFPDTNGRIIEVSEKIFGPDTQFRVSQQVGSADLRNMIGQENMALQYWIRVGDESTESSKLIKSSYAEQMREKRLIHTNMKLQYVNSSLGFRGMPGVYCISNISFYLNKDFDKKMWDDKLEEDAVKVPHRDIWFGNGFGFAREGTYGSGRKDYEEVAKDRLNIILHSLSGAELSAEIAQAFNREPHIYARDKPSQLDSPLQKESALSFTDRFSIIGLFSEDIGRAFSSGANLKAK